MGKTAKTLLTIGAITQIPIGFMYLFSKSKRLQTSSIGKNLMKYSMKAVTEIPLLDKAYEQEYKLLQTVRGE